MKAQNKALPSVVVSAFMSEYSTLSPEGQTLVRDWLSEFKLMGVSNYFTSECQAILIKQIAENQFLRTFVLNHSERVYLLSLFADEVSATWFEEVSLMVRTYRSRLVIQTILPEAVMESLYVSGNELKSLIDNNPWILTFYLVLITDGVFDYMEELENKFD